MGLHCAKWVNGQRRFLFELILKLAFLVDRRIWCWWMEENYIRYQEGKNSGFTIFPRVPTIDYFVFIIIWNFLSSLNLFADFFKFFKCRLFKTFKIFKIYHKTCIIYIYFWLQGCYSRPTRSVVLLLPSTPLLGLKAKQNKNNQPRQANLNQYLINP